jgi:hypothetical protein
MGSNASFGKAGFLMGWSPVKLDASFGAQGKAALRHYKVIARRVGVADQVRERRCRR